MHRCGVPGVPFRPSHRIDARREALSPTDIEADIGLRKLEAESERQDAPDTEEEVPAFETKKVSAACINEPLDDSLTSAKPARGRGRTRERDLDNSLSHQIVRDLSEFHRFST